MRPPFFHPDPSLSQDSWRVFTKQNQASVVGTTRLVICGPWNPAHSVNGEGLTPFLKPWCLESHSWWGDHGAPCNELQCHIYWVPWYFHSPFFEKFYTQTLMVRTIYKISISGEFTIFIAIFQIPGVTTIILMFRFPGLGHATPLRSSEAPGIYMLRILQFPRLYGVTGFARPLRSDGWPKEVETFLYPAW